MEPEEQPLYNSRIMDNYVKLIRRKYPHVPLQDLLAHAGMEPYQIADQGHWFTQDQINRFHDNVADFSGNPDIAREAGRFAASAEALGAMRQWTLGLLGPAKTFAMISKATANITRSSTYEHRQLASNKAEITVRVKDGLEERPFQCNNRMGFFEAIVLIFNYKILSLEHPECIFRGGACCRYEITWEKPPSARLKTFRNVLTAVLGGGALIGWAFNPALLLQALLPASAIALLVLSLTAERWEKSELKERLEELRDPTEKMIEQINSNYSNARITNEIGQAISEQTAIEAILDRVTVIMQKRLDFQRGVILLTNHQRDHLEFRAGYGADDGTFDLIRQTDYPLQGDQARGVFVTCLLEQRPFLVQDLEELSERMPQQSLEFARQLGTSAFICCPIVCEGEAIGVLAVDHARSDRPLVQSDLNLLMSIAPVVGISIYNAELMEIQHEQLSAIHALEKARDEIAEAKDKSEHYAQELQQINEELKSFTYIVSHDLRAPLVNIRGFAGELNASLKDVEQTLAKCLPQLEEQERKEMELVFAEDVPEALEFINTSISRMDGLINAILKLSRAGRREFLEEQLSLKELLEGILKTLTHQLERQQTQVQIGELPDLVADRVAIEQVFGNLLDNAVKYLDPSRDGQLEVSAEIDAGEILFRLKDNGRGISEADLQKVFDIFRRSGKQDVKGEGLGLAYVRTLVRRLGGQIWCESELGVGTTFCVALPLSMLAKDAA